MIRVFVVVEGQTEESFVSRVVAPEFWGKQIFITPRLLGRPGHRGGRVNYERVRGDVLRLLKEQRSAYCTMLADYYGLGKGFPGTPASEGLTDPNKARLIESAIKQDINELVPELRPDLRFIPYLQLHEYEGLLFSDPAAFASGINQAHLTQRFRKIRDQFETPEDINNSPETAPSKRVIQAYAGYRKVIEGTQAALAVGLQAMRAECPHFRDWPETLETLKPLT